MTALNSGYVGMGIGAPGYQLHVKSSDTDEMNMALDTSDASANTVLKLRKDGVSKWDLMNIGANDCFQITEAGTPAVTIEPTSRNVGIGTVAPNTRLHIHEDSGA